MGGTILDVDVLFDEGGILVVDKPAGLATLPGTGVADDETLLFAMRQAFPVEPGFHGPSIFGRLDRPTSGIVMAALSRHALEAVEPAWTSGAIHKDYLVVVHGKVPARGRIDVPLAARRPRHKGTGRIEEALTTFVRVSGSPTTSVVLARLHTGRTHQIRRHMKAIGHPLVGDDRYGHAVRDADLPADVRDAGLLLHAWRLGHRGDVPILPARLEAPLPPRWTTALRALGVTAPAADFSLEPDEP